MSSRERLRERQSAGQLHEHEHVDLVGEVGLVVAAAPAGSRCRPRLARRRRRRSGCPARRVAAGKLTSSTPALRCAAAGSSSYASSKRSMPPSSSNAADRVAASGRCRGSAEVRAQAEDRLRSTVELDVAEPPLGDRGSRARSRAPRRAASGGITGRSSSCCSDELGLDVALRSRRGTSTLTDAPMIATSVDERDADHQGRRGRGRAPRVARRVLAREPARHPAQSRRQPTDHPCHGPRDERAEHRDADEHERAHRQPDERPRRRQGTSRRSPNRPSTTQDDAEHREHPADGEAAAARASRRLASARRAAIGGDAQRPAAPVRCADTTVTTVPTTSDTMIVRVGSPGAVTGRSNPNARMHSSRPMATSDAEDPRPRIEDSSPTASASSATEPVTCRPDAPSARSNPSSRARCATMIENVL